ncbi:MAG TPA: hypothetical protein VK886_18780 [Vicinamibacterales bacterium]|nr:hypothetical protein [Vicinamibacterales bacterium]
MLPARSAIAALLLAALSVVAGCRREVRPPIVVEDRVVRVHNQTPQRWSNVRVWLNDHYVAETPEIGPNGRFTVLQRDFIAAMGQKFDPSRQRPYGVLVTASSAEGDVKLVWGKPYKQ